jgi:hypothetical protein
MESTADKTYFAKWLLTLESIVTRLCYRSHEVDRLIAYKSEGPLYSKADGRKLLNDIAITVGVSPVALGASTDPKCRVYVPLECKLEVTPVDDVLDFLDNPQNQRDKHSYGVGEKIRMINRFSTIEECILELHIESAPRAVLVCEHRNMSGFFEDIGMIHKEWQQFIVALVGLQSLVECLKLT